MHLQYHLSSLKEALKQDFEMTDLDAASNYLGTKLEKYRTSIFSHQKSYIHQKFGLFDCNNKNLPMDQKTLLQKDMNTPSPNTQEYRFLVGSLIYITNTRPDICYAVSCVTRYMDKPQTAHFQVAKRILRYFSGTLDYGLFFLANSVNLYHIFADAD